MRRILLKFEKGSVLLSTARAGGTRGTGNTARETDSALSILRMETSSMAISVMGSQEVKVFTNGIQVICMKGGFREAERKD